MNFFTITSPLLFFFLIPPKSSVQLLLLHIGFLHSILKKLSVISILSIVAGDFFKLSQEYKTSISLVTNAYFSLYLLGFFILKFINFKLDLEKYTFF